MTHLIHTLPRGSRRLLLLLLAVVTLEGGAIARGQEQPAEILSRARALYQEEGPGPALPVYEQALAAFRAVNDERGEAVTLGLMGNCHKRFGDYGEALELLNAALTLKRRLGDRPEEGKTLSHLGLVYWELGDYDNAIRYFQASSDVARQVHDVALEGANLNNLSLVYDELGDYERSLAGYEQALEAYRAIDFPRGEGDALANIGGVHLLLGRYREACGFYRQSKVISEKENLKYSLSHDHGSLAQCQLGLGLIDEAIADFDRALELTREMGASQDEAYWMSGKGTALVKTGRYAEGLTLLRTAVERYDEMGSRGEALEALHQLGELYLTLGDLASAEEHFRRALDTARDIGAARPVTLNLTALGDLEWRRGHFERSQTLYAQALGRAREAGEQGLIAESLLRLAAAHRRQGRLAEAFESVTEALAIGRSTEVPSLEAEAELSLGHIAVDQGEIENGLARLARAHEVADRVADPDLLWRIRHAQGVASDRLGRHEEAIAALEEAVEIIESVRSRLREERFRAGYLEDRYSVYVDLVRLLLRLKQPEAAFSVSERLRVHSYLELTRRHRASQAPSEASRQREVELRERIRQLQRAIDAEQSYGGATYRQRAVDHFSSELIAAEREYQAFLDDLRSDFPHELEPRDLEVPTLDEIRSALRPGTLLLEYVVTERSLVVFGLTERRLLSLQIDESRRQIEAKIALLRDLIRQTDNDEWRRPALALAKVLLHPLADAGWLEGIERLWIVPHGALHHLPFAALPSDPSGATLLVEEMTLSLLPAAATMTGTVNQGEADESLLALAPASSGLRHTPAEVRGVSALFASKPRVLVGASALESTFKSVASDFRVVHLASHGYFNQLNPMLSGLQLEADDADDGQLQVHEILNLDLHAELVVLSACDTGLSSGHLYDVPVGDDFVGLTRAFLHAGSDAVLSTLWSVNDQSTLALMQHFYRSVAQESSLRDPANALSQAQRWSLKHPEYRHPYHWAPFVLVERGGDTASLLAENDSRVLVEQE